MKTQALDHKLQWSLSARAEHVDNVFLSATQKEYLASAIASPYIRYEAASPLWQTHLSTSANFRKTSDESFDTNDYSHFAGVSRAGEYSSFSAEVSRVDSTVREINIAESTEVTNDPVITDSAQARWQYQWRMNDSFSFSANHLSRDYTSENYSDYEDSRFTGMWQHHFTEHFASQAQIYYGEYASERVNTDEANTPVLVSTSENGSNTYGLQVGVFGQLSATLQYNLLAGASTVEIEQNFYKQLRDENQVPFNVYRQTNSTNSNVFSGSLSYTGERTQVQIRADKQLQATGNGIQLDTSQVQANGSYRWAQFWTIHCGANYGEQKAVEGNTAIGRRLDRDFSQANLGVTHRLSPHWTASLYAYYNGQKYHLDRDRAESVTGMFQMRFQPEYLVW